MNLKIIAATTLCLGGLMLLPNSAYAYKTMASCEEHEGTGKCCDLGPQAGGGRHYGKCSYNSLGRKERPTTPKPSTTPIPSR